MNTDLKHCLKGRERVTEKGNKKLKKSDREDKGERKRIRKKETGKGNGNGKSR